MRTRLSSQSGSSLFEVLISVLVLGLGMLGLAATQTAALRHTRHALEYSAAAQQAQSLLEIMRSHRGAAHAGHYHSGGWACDAHTGSEIGRWLHDLQAALGDTACAEIVCQTGAVWCSVRLRWGDAARQADEHTLATRTRL